MDGQWVGVVNSGVRQRFEAVRPGDHTVSAVGAGLTPQSAVVTCASGAICRWDLLPMAGEGDALPAPPALGDLNVRNDSGHTVLVTQPNGGTNQLFARSSQHIRNVASGELRLRVTVPGTDFVQMQTVTVRPDVSTDLALAVPTGSVQIMNKTGEAIILHIDGRRSANIPDNTTHTESGLLRGVRDLMAVGDRTKRVHRHTIHIADAAGQTLTWDLTAASGTLVIKNTTDQELLLSLGDQSLGTLAAQSVREFDSLPMGANQLSAAVAGSESTWRTDILLSTNQKNQWTVSDTHGAVMVVNERTEAIEIHHHNRTLAVVPPNQAMLLDRLAAGKQPLVAFGTTSHRTERKAIHVNAQHGQRWVLGPTATQLHVINKMPEEVSIYVDRLLMGAVAANGEVIFTQLSAGKRVLEAVGAMSGKRISRTRDMAPDQTTAWDVQAAVGQLRVTNRTDETLLTPPGMRHQAEHIVVGQPMDFSIPVGTQQVHLIGQDSGQSYGKRLTITAGKNSVWEVQPMMGKLHVFNRTAESQSIQIDRTPAGTVAAGKQRTFGLRSGPHRLVATAEKSGMAIANTARIVHGHSASWTLRPAQATVRIVNNTGEVLDLRLNGETLGHLEADGERLYGPFPPGAHKFSALGRWSGSGQEAALTLRGGRTDTWEVLPQYGSVQIQNQRLESIRVKTSGHAPVVVQSQETHVLSLPQGRHLIEIEGTKTHAHFIRAVALRPHRTLAVVAPLGPAAIRVENTLPVAVRVQANQSLLGTVPAQSTVSFPLSKLGWVTLEAVGPDERLRWHRRIRLDEDRETRWRIVP